VVGLGATVLAGAGQAAAVSHRNARLALGVGAIGALLVLRHDFPAVPHPRRVRGAMWVAAVGLAIVFAHICWLAITGRSAPTGLAHPLQSGFLGLVSAISILVAVTVLLAAAPAPAPDTPTQRARVAALVAHPDTDSLAPFVTRADKTYAFSPD